jgi:hypothetical protein
MKITRDSAKAPLHILQVYRDTRSFIDIKRIETGLATDYHMQSKAFTAARNLSFIVHRTRTVFSCHASELK